MGFLPPSPQGPKALGWASLHLLRQEAPVAPWSSEGRGGLLPSRGSCLQSS